MSQSVFLKTEQKATFQITLFSFFQSVPVYLFIAALSELIFVLHRETLSHSGMSEIGIKKTPRSLEQDSF
jgi:hypothetical protein